MSDPLDPQPGTPRHEPAHGDSSRPAGGTPQPAGGTPQPAGGTPWPAGETSRPPGETSRPDTDPRSVRVTDDGITEVGFDDPELRPLPADKLHYHVPHADAHPESHEHSDVPIRPLAITLAAIAGTCLLTFGLLYWLFWSYKGNQDASEMPRTAIPNAKPVVPEPRLQGVPSFSDNHPTQDLVQMRRRYEAELNGYGANGDTPTARIPIDRAMQLAIERKLFPVSAPGAGAGAGRAPGAVQGDSNVQGATSQRRGAQATPQPNPQQGGNPPPQPGDTRGGGNTQGGSRGGGSGSGEGAAPTRPPAGQGGNR